MHNFAGIILIKWILHQKPLANIHPPMQTKIKQSADRHKSNTAQLDEQNQHYLSKKAELLTSIPHSETGYTGGRGSCEKGIQGISPLAINMGNRQA